ncbi:unnamed protein product [Fusarium equiseti]|uniref:Uncharacterized protein n=1 Tax=Fusarium equiseti TaxID=61235 RepID=A0A8J2NE55_FUSEQ|nr:unnamed protein product [Fusarium equiseti]
MFDIVTEAEWRECMRERKDMPDPLPRIAEKRFLFDVLSDNSEDRVGKVDSERYCDETNESTKKGDRDISDYKPSEKLDNSDLKIRKNPAPEAR